MKSGKVAGPSGIVIEMIRSAGEGIISSITQLANCIVMKIKFQMIGTFPLLLVYIKAKATLYQEVTIVAPNYLIKL